MKKEYKKHQHEEDCEKRGQGKANNQSFKKN